MAKIQSELLDAIRINCPEWFEREDFMNWLKDGQATWYREGTDICFADTFLVFDDGEGDIELMPEDIREEIEEIVYAAGLTYCIVWLSPVASPEDEKWIICGKTENETDPETGDRLYWSNECGWVSRDTATEFTAKEAAMLKANGARMELK